MSYLNLNKSKTEQTAGQLNILLSDYHLYYQKLRNFHWNISGRNFFDLHIKFEEMYNDTLLKIDEIAERILTLRYQPVSNFSEYIERSSIKESKAGLEDVVMIDTLIKDHSVLLKQLREVAVAATDAEDEGTIDLIGGYIRELEK